MPRSATVRTIAEPPAGPELVVYQADGNHASVNVSLSPSIAETETIAVTLPLPTQRPMFGGLLVRKECWTLSLRGKLLAVLFVMVGALAVSRGLYHFLAVTNRTSGDVLVVEGWIREYSIEQVASEYLSAPYRAVLVVSAVYPSGNKWDSGLYMSEYIARNLVDLGVPKSRVHIVLCDVLKKDRTYHSALAVRAWLREHDMPAKSLDVATIGPHARRSRILFRKAFRDELRVGVIALNERDYDTMHWWRSSEGVREVLFEAVAYLYARFCFHPPAPLP